MTHAVKSRLLRLSPLESILEKLIELLPRTNVCVELNPRSNIEVLPRNGEYKATGPSSCFTVNFENGFTSGWYYLEAVIVRNNGDRSARILGVANERLFEIPIPSNLRGSIREVFYLPCGVAELTWQATKGLGFFSQTNLLIHKIGRLESILRRAHRILYDIWRFRRTDTARSNGLTLCSALININSAYCKSAQLRLNRHLGNDYSRYVEFSNKRDGWHAKEIRRKKFYVKENKKFTLVVICRDSNISHLVSTIDSVIGQCYSNYEMLLVDCSSDTVNLGDFLWPRYQNKRIVTVVPPNELDNSNASLMLNYAVSNASGDFFLRIACGDTLPSYALTYFAHEFYLNGKLDVVYGDNDYIGVDGKRCNPEFKPDWNIDLLFSCNYIGSPCVYLISKLREIGGYSKEYRFAEDYELILRYLDGSTGSNISHIQTVLYHRSKDSVEFNLPIEPNLIGGTRDSVHCYGKKALQKNLEKLGVNIEDGPSSALYHAIYPIPNPSPMVSIIIPTKDRIDLLSVCIDSILSKTEYANFEIVIVDNDSSDPDTIRYFEKVANDVVKVVVYGGVFNYSAINNFAAHLSKGSVLALLNNDIEVIDKKWLDELVGHAMRPGIGAVGAKLLYPDGAIQHGGVIIGFGGVAGHAHRFIDDKALGYCARAVVTQSMSAVTGACLVVKKDRYFEVGGLNEEDLAVAFNDVDFCLKLREQGYRNIYAPFARLYHHESISRGQDDTPEKASRFAYERNYMKRFWGEKLMNDPAYNRNLSLSFESFSFGECV